MGLRFMEAGPPISRNKKLKIFDKCCIWYKIAFMEKPLSGGNIYIYIYFPPPAPPALGMEEAMATHCSTLPGKSHGRRSLPGYSPWGRWGSDTTERLHFQFSLSCIGEGNGNPFQCSCLENPRDRGTWWAAVYGVAQSRTRLKWLSSSSIRHV